MRGEVYVVPGSGQGHLYPSMELCNHLTQRDYYTTLVAPSTLSSVIPSSFTKNPKNSIVHIAPSPRFKPGSDLLSLQAAQDLHAHLENQLKVQDAGLPLCAIVDFQMGWTKTVFWKFNIPVIGFFTFGASAAAMEWGAWKVQASDIIPGETRLIPGLPEEMAINNLDIKRKAFGPRHGGGGPKPGDRPPWVPEIEGSIALMFNTCDDLDGVFIKYMEQEMQIPAWGVGPLFPEKYWKISLSLIHDNESKEHRRESSVTEQEVLQWLESKAPRSVLYIAFGSEVTPTKEECQQLANALEETAWPFIWVVPQKSDQPMNNFEEKIGDRGLIIYGWAPQLLILSHKSTGGFLSHCGWNSTMEAVGSGVPFLSWPIRGDQYFNAKLVVNYLKLGYRVADDLSEMVKKEDIMDGIERLMGDEDIHERAAKMKEKFDHGFPKSSMASLDSFKEFIDMKFSSRRVQ